MRTTLNLKDDLFREAAKITGIQEKTKLIHLALENLLQKKAAEKLAALHGYFRGAKAAPRKKLKWR